MIETITGTSGGAVGSDTNRNINLLGTNVTVAGTPSSHTLLLTANMGVVSWHSITTNTPLAVNTGYICMGGTNLQLTLPASSSVGDTIEITLDGSISFVIKQNAGQQIRYGDRETAVGTGGQLISMNPGDSVRLVCSIASTRWNATSTMGNLTVV